MPNAPYPTWIEIDLKAIEYNTRKIHEWCGVDMMGVVKDNGYGHGAVEVSRAFLRAGGTWLGVVRVQEGLELREAGIEAPILALGGAAPEEIETAVRMGVSLPLYSFELASLIARAARSAGMPAKVHLKIDTGMGRYGVYPEETAALARCALELGGIEIEGIFSHLATAGDDQVFALEQVANFNQALASLKETGIQPRWVHLCNSNGVFTLPGAFYNLVRTGQVLYGQWPNRSTFPFELARGFTWKAKLLSCKLVKAGLGVGYMQTYRTSGDEWIGVIPVGYGDGYHRVHDTEVLVGGERVPVVGNVGMDQFMVRLPRRYPIGEEVVLIGRQGTEEIFVEELQRIWKSTISMVELIHPRVPRFYLGE